MGASRAAVLAGLVGAACGTVLEAAPDGVAIDDAGTVADGSAPDASVNEADAPIVRSTFDTGNCAPWIPQNGSTIEPTTSPTRSGPGSCRVCTPKPTAHVVAHFEASERSGTYLLSGWVRADVPVSAALAIETGSGNGRNVGPASTDAWTLVQAASRHVGIPGGGPEGNALLSVSEPDGGCYAVDDLVLTFEPD
jgi:hypothetical protein